MAEELSKSAKKRLAKKARDEKAAEEQAPAAAPKAAAAKAKPAAAPAAAGPKAAAAAPKTAAAPTPAKAKAAAPTQPSCNQCGTQFKPDDNFCNNCGAKRPAAGGGAQAKAKAEVKAKVEPKVAAEPKAAAKAESKKPKKSPVAAPAPAPENIMTFSFEDDGTGGWENQAVKKKDKQKEKQDAKKEEAKAEEAKAAAPKAKSEGGKSAPKAKSAAKEKEQPQASASGQSAAQRMIAALEADATAKARAQIAQKALEGAAKGKGKGKDGEEGEVEAVNPNWVTGQVTVPSEKMGRIIGPGGKTLKMIQEKTGVGKIDTQGDTVTIIGDPEPVKLCEVAIREMVDKGFMTCSYDNYAEDNVMVHPEHFPNLIGQRGAIIRKIKEDVHVEISIPQDATKDANGKWGKKKYPVQICGSAVDVATAKQVIMDIVKFKHHAITHPDKEHFEMEVPDWAHRYIIGPKGSEMRHIQNSFKVEVNIPRESNADTGACENVLIVGPSDGVEKAKAHIEKLIHTAETAAAKKPAREDAAADDERNKGDDEVDAEAAKYLIKKK